MQQRVLFVCESVTTAQVVRLVLLARSLDRNRYEVHFASDWLPPEAFADRAVTCHPLATIGARAVERALSRGSRLYGDRTLKRYVRDELALFSRVRPDAVVGDFRLSLPVSAPLSGIPLLTLINAYWHPKTNAAGYPLPEHPIVRLLGPARAAEHFPKALPHVFDHFAAPVNRLRRRHGLPRIGSLPEVLMYGDRTVHPDVPELVPALDPPDGHTFLGGLCWAPTGDLPSNFRATGGRPRVYATLGSSGPATMLPTLLAALGSLPIQALVATAGRESGRLRVPDNVEVAHLVPGNLAARASALVITNGGSSTGYQALAEGTPVLGLPFNMDQYLAMRCIERAGAGVTVRSGQATVAVLAEAIGAALADTAMARAANRLASAFRGMDAAERFEAVLQGVLGAGDRSVAHHAFGTRTEHRADAPPADLQEVSRPPTT